MRRLVKWIGFTLGGLALTLLLVLQLGFSDPLSAAMSLDKPGVWSEGLCQSVDAQEDTWRNEARGLGPDSEPLEWRGPGGAIDAATQRELSNALKEWVADPGSQFGSSASRTVAIEARDAPEPCMKGHVYSRAAVRGDLAFVATEYRCGFDCANGGIIALRKIGWWWFPIADTDTWIT
jgi:hypothetical protein